MGATPDQTEALKQHVKLLGDIVNAKAIDWSQVAQIVMQLVQLLFTAHVK